MRFRIEGQNILSHTKIYIQVVLAPSKQEDNPLHRKYYYLELCNVCQVSSEGEKTSNMYFEPMFWDTTKGFLFTAKKQIGEYLDRA